VSKQRFGTSKVTNFEQVLGSTRLLVQSDQYIVWLDVPMRDIFTVQEGESFEELVSHSLDLVIPDLLACFELRGCA